MKTFYKELGVKRTASLTEIYKGYLLQTDMNNLFCENNEKTDKAFYALLYPRSRILYDNYLLDTMKPRMMRGAYFVGAGLFTFLAMGLYPLVTGPVAFSLALAGFVEHGNLLVLKREMEDNLFSYEMNGKRKKIYN